MRPESPRSRRVAVVTGAGSGIGRAIAQAAARDGGIVGLVGRRLDALEEVAGQVERCGGRAVRFPGDLIAPGGAERLAEQVVERLGTIDLLVHCAGVFPFTPADADATREHPRAAEVLTRRLLPLLRASPGQIVFVNSSVGVVGAAATGVYAESKQALRVLADWVRAEVNPEGIRVLSVYPGRTASPMQEALHRQEGKPYRPERLLQPDDVAAVVMFALGMPPGAEVTDVSIRPMLKP